jgi:hypothetical protein
MSIPRINVQVVEINDRNTRVGVYGELPIYDPVSGKDTWIFRESRTISHNGDEITYMPEIFRAISTLSRRIAANMEHAMQGATA